jgi:hypothetical protein
MSDVALRFGAKDDGLDAKFRKVDDQLEKFKSHASNISGSISGVFKAIKTIGAVVAIGKLASEALEFADALKKVQAQTGFSTDAIQRLQFMAGQSSVDVGNLTNGVLKLQRAMGGFEEGSEQASKALDRLGLANAAFQNKNPEQQFIAVAEALAGIADQNQKVIAGTELFGKGFSELQPVLEAIGKDSAELEARFDAIGGPVGQQAIDAVDNLGDELATAGLAAKSLVTELLAMIAPPVIAGLHGLQTVVAATRLAIKGGEGDNELVNLDNRIRELQAFIAKPTGFFTDRGYIKALREAHRELDALVLKQQVLLGVGQGGLLNPAVQNFPVNIPLPDTVGFEETDADRQKREKDESDRRLQRIQQIATMHQIEEDMAFKSSERLAQIDQAALDAEIERLTIATGEKLHIRTTLEEASAILREQFGLQEIKLEELKNQSILELGIGLLDALAVGNKKFAKIQQGLAIAEIIWSTATGIMKAFETLPWPASLVAAGQVALVGAIQYQKVKSTNYIPGSISGTPSSLGGGSGAAANTPAPARQDQDSSQVQSATTVYISGYITKDVIDQLLAGLRDGFDRNVILIPQNSLQAQVIRNG